MPVDGRGTARVRRCDRQHGGTGRARELLERRSADGGARPPPAHAVSLQGHGASHGRLRTTLLRHYADDVVATAGMGYDLILDARWRQPLDAMLGWLGARFPAERAAAV
jgi:hypothetical protein